MGSKTTVASEQIDRGEFEYQFDLEIERLSERLGNKYDLKAGRKVIQQGTSRGRNRLGIFASTLSAATAQGQIISFDHALLKQLNALKKQGPPPSGHRAPPLQEEVQFKFVSKPCWVKKDR